MVPEGNQILEEVADVKDDNNKPANTRVYPTRECEEPDWLIYPMMYAQVTRNMVPDDVKINNDVRDKHLRSNPVVTGGTLKLGRMALQMAIEQKHNMFHQAVGNNNSLSYNARESMVMAWLIEDLNLKAQLGQQYTLKKA